MNLPAFCIKRPVFTIVISLVMSIIGVLGFMNLPVRWIPNVTLPQLSIETLYPGANARLIEHDVTKVIEDAMSGVTGIDQLTSTSRQGRSDISLTFKLGYNMDAALQDVRSSLERISGSLPQDAKHPVVLKADVNNDVIMYLSFHDTKRSPRELSDYIEKFILPAFESLDGVGRVDVYGKRTSAMLIHLDPTKMAGANITVDDITQLLGYQQAAIPSGQIRAKDRYYSVLTDMSLKSAAQFNDLILRDDANQIVRLKDVGVARLDAEDTDSVFRINGKPGMALGIIAQSTANPLTVESNVKKVFTDLKRTLPAGMQASVFYDQADYVRSSIHSVYEAFIEAIICVWIVIFIFLGNFRATWIPIVTIPVCSIATFAVLYFLGFSINTLTLMAFVLAIGLVVDDAIVMLENINRRIEEGMLPLNAALKGSQEMVFPIIAMTITLAAVYAPIAFTPGLLGVLFREFTFTLASAVLISGVVALTLSPMMCARFLRPIDQQQHAQRRFTRYMDIMQQRYQLILGKILKKRSWVLAGLLIAGFCGAGLYYWLPSELAPTEDMNEIHVRISAPRGSSFNYLDTHVRELEAIYPSIPDVTSFLTVGGRSAAHGFQLLTLKPKKERQKPINELIEDINAKAKRVAGVRVNVYAPSPPLAEMAGGDEGDRLGLTVKTTGDYRRLQQSTQQLMEALKQTPGFAHVDNSLKWDNVQFQVNIDRDKAADLKVSIPSIANTISTLIAGKIIGKVEDANVIVQMTPEGLSKPDIFNSLYVRNNSGQMVALANVISIKETTSPEVYKHDDRLRSDSINMTLSPDTKVSTAIAQLETLAKTHLSEDIKYSFSGEARSFLEAAGKTLFTFALALIFIYLVLAAQFESFIDPLIILLTVPFAMVGALLTLKIFGGSLNIYSQIGMITLIGLIAKHGILITEFANRLRYAGYTIEQAVTEAAIMRLRPICMTTAAMILGALPLAFASGPGAESRQQIGLVIAGGLLFGTLFSLIIVPVFYTYLSALRKIVKTPDLEEDQRKPLEEANAIIL